MPRRGEFSSHCKNGHARTPENIGSKGHCKACALYYHRNWRNNNRERCRNSNRKSHLKNDFKMSVEDFERKLQEQDNKCAICGRDFDSSLKGMPHVDHDHACCSGVRSCGKCVRNIVCHKCNIVIAYADDDPEILQHAIEYLKKWTKQ
jgi:hypothetical protein